jgi:flagellar basal body P-ring formation protein FlgA
MRILAVLFMLLAAHVAVAEVVLELRKDVLVRGPLVTLGELAVLDADHADLGASVVGKAPLAGHVELRNRQELADQLARQQRWRGQTLVWRGADIVRIRADAVTMPGERLANEAARYLHATFAGRYARLEVAAASPVPDVVVPPGLVSLQVRPSVSKRLTGRVALWVDIMSGGVVQRSVVVPMRVSAWQEVLVARDHVAEGVLSGALQFDARIEQVEGLEDDAAGRDALQQKLRLKRALAQGQILMRKDLAPVGAILRGDRVRLLSGGPAVQVEVGAIAEGDALEGQPIAVRPANGGGVVMARVTGPGEVRLDER